MLNDDDMDWLIEQLAATSELLGQQMSTPAVMMLAEDLMGYDRLLLADALRRVRDEHTGRLTTKAVIERIDAVTGRPGANEAWAIALTALDERNTVVWTGEMTQAWEAARPVARAGDLIGARMTFIGAYERLCRAARDQRRMPEISVSVGWDAGLRAAAIEKALALGYVSGERAVALGCISVGQALALGYLSPGRAVELEGAILPLGYTPDVPMLAHDAAPAIDVLALAKGACDAPAAATPTMREKFRELKATLLARNRRDAEEKARNAAAAAADLAARKAAAQRMAASHPEFDPAAALRSAEWAAAGRGVAA